MEIGGWVGQRLMEQHASRLEDAIRSHALDRPGHQFDLLPTTCAAASPSTVKFHSSASRRCRS
ncbi:MAG: hypothetical protein VB036_00395, partial [Propionicimonas sp.]|nr:hypothetical protein [Propionicimonas sp.]